MAKPVTSGENGGPGCGQVPELSSMLTAGLPAAAFANSNRVSMRPGLQKLQKGKAGRGSSQVSRSLGAEGQLWAATLVWHLVGARLAAHPENLSISPKAL